MLVLSRRKDEAIMIGKDVQIMVIAIRGDKVRLGITAPKDVQVHRQEVFDAIQREEGQEKDKPLTTEQVEAWRSTNTLETDLC